MMARILALIFFPLSSLTLCGLAAAECDVMASCLSSLQTSGISRVLEFPKGTQNVVKIDGKSTYLVKAQKGAGGAYDIQFRLPQEPGSSGKGAIYYAKLTVDEKDRLLSANIQDLMGGSILACPPPALKKTAAPDHRMKNSSVGNASNSGPGNAASRQGN